MAVPSPEPDFVGLFAALVILTLMALAVIL